MLGSLLFPPVACLLALLVSGFVAFMARKGNAAMTFSGCLLAFLGVGFLAGGKIVQDWRGGPPLEGTPATFGSLLMVCFGGCIILVAFFKEAGFQSQDKCLVDLTNRWLSRYVIPSEVEESLDISDHSAVASIKRCLDFARHDKLVGAIDLNRPLVVW
jgi:hypothetical protein